MISIKNIFLIFLFLTIITNFNIDAYAVMGVQLNDVNIWCPQQSYESYTNFFSSVRICPLFGDGGGGGIRSPPQQELDTDQDGIKNNIDACPLIKEIFNNFKDTDGCPDTIFQEPKYDRNELIDKIKDIFNKDTLKTVFTTPKTNLDNGESFISGGNSSNMNNALWIILALIVLFLFLIIFAKRRKKNKKKHRYHIGKW